MAKPKQYKVTSSPDQEELWGEWFGIQLESPDNDCWESNVDIYVKANNPEGIELARRIARLLNNGEA